MRTVRDECEVESFGLGWETIIKQNCDRLKTFKSREVEDQRTHTERYNKKRGIKERYTGRLHLNLFTQSLQIP